MKTAFTYKKWSFMLAFLSLMMIYHSSTAQRRAPAAKCAGFTAKITNGSYINLCSGTSVSLQSSPNVAGYTYQWQIQTSAGGPFVNISDATGTAYSTSNLGAYRVFISTGSCVDTSGIVSVVRIAPEGGKLTTTNNGPFCLGEKAGKITGTQVPGADLGIITFAWEKNEGSGWSTISQASDINYIVGPLTQTTKFRRVSMDNCGNKAYSNEITMQLASTLLPGTVAPETQTIHRGQTPATIASATPASGGSGNYGYQWQWSHYERGPYSNISGATGASYSPGALQQTTYYKRIVTDQHCLNSADAPMAIVYVVDGILDAGSFVSNSSCFFQGQSTSPLQTLYPPTGGVPPYTVEWQSSTDNVNFTSIPGANGNTYQPGILTQTTYFRKKVTDAAGTVAYTESEKISLVSTTLMGGTIQATSNVACLGSNPAEIKSIGSASGYGEDIIYQWQYKTASSGGWVNIPDQIREGLLPEPITEKTWFRREAIDRCGPNKRSAYSNEIEIDTRPALLAGDIAPTSQMIRIGGTPKPLTSVEGPSGGTGSYSITWEQAPLAVGPWTTISSQTGVNYQPESVSQSTYYRRVVTDNNCLATKYTYTVELYLNTTTPVKGGSLGGSQCVFPGNTPGLITASTPASEGTPPYTYSWESRPGTSGNWTVIAGATGETYQPGVLTQTTQFRRKVTDYWGEFAYTDAFTVEYHTAALNPGTIAISTSPVVCAGTTPGNIESVTPYAGYGENPSYQWQTRTAGGAWTDIAGATGASYQPTSITQMTYFRRAASDMCGGATRTTYSNEVVFTLPVKVNLKAGLVDGPFITCSGTAPGTIKSVLDACGSVSPLHYQWESKSAGGAWTAIAGATSASYTPGAITKNMQYRRKVMDECGTTGYSNTVEIYVYPPIEPGVIGTETQSVCMNQAPAMIRLLTDCHYTDGTVTYQWQMSSSATGPWSDISGANANQYQPAGSTTSSYYRLKVMSTTCSFVAYTNVASVMVNAGCSGLVAGNRALATPSGDMKVYPNPLTGTSVTVKVDTKGTVNVRMLNSEGRAIPVSVSNTGGGIMKVDFMKTPSKGMYVLTVVDEKSSWTKKVLVQ